MKTLPLIIAASLAITLAGCKPGDQAKIDTVTDTVSEAAADTAGEMKKAVTDVMPSAASAMSVEKLRVIPPLPGRTVAIGTFNLTNGGADDVLLSASSPISGRVELHTHIKEGDVMKMRRMDNLAVAAGETVEFKRGGYHLMMFDTVMPDGATTPVTLTFQNAGDVTLDANIAGR